MQRQETCEQCAGVLEVDAFYCDQCGQERFFEGQTRIVRRKPVPPPPDSSENVSAFLERELGRSLPSYTCSTQATASRTVPTVPTSVRYAPCRPLRLWRIDWRVCMALSALMILIAAATHLTLPSISLFVSPMLAALFVGRIVGLAALFRSNPQQW